MASLWCLSAFTVDRSFSNVRTRRPVCVAIATNTLLGKQNVACVRQMNQKRSAIPGRQIYRAQRAVVTTLGLSVTSSPQLHKQLDIRLPVFTNNPGLRPRGSPRGARLPGFDVLQAMIEGRFIQAITRWQDSTA
jgi:hypothetical protein